MERIELSIVGSEGGRDVSDIAVPKQLLEYRTLRLIERLDGMHIVNPLCSNIANPEARSDGTSPGARERH
jgi:hypothetical protein